MDKVDFLWKCSLKAELWIVLLMFAKEVETNMKG